MVAGRYSEKSGARRERWSTACTHQPWLATFSSFRYRTCMEIVLYIPLRTTKDTANVKVKPHCIRLKSNLGRLFQTRLGKDFQ